MLLAKSKRPGLRNSPRQLCQKWGSGKLPLLSSWCGPYGPYLFSRSSRKLYILLFTCAVVRAVHLELVNSLNMEDCVLAIRRFVAWRGLQTIIWSDNAKAFVATQTRLLGTYGVICPEWRFIPPRSPWWGGWWEENSWYQVSSESGTRNCFARSRSLCKLQTINLPRGRGRWCCPTYPIVFFDRSGECLWSKKSQCPWSGNDKNITRK